MNYIYTLGPAMTNCEKAAMEWNKKTNSNAEIILFDTLEDAFLQMQQKNDKNILLMSCIVYPKLFELVFDNLIDMEFQELYLTDTYPMVLATKDLDATIQKVASHPAPRPLLKDTNYEVHLANSNSEAALLCVNGVTDACITTGVCVEKHNLNIVKDFGKVKMGFALHKLKS